MEIVAPFSNSLSLKILFRCLKIACTLKSQSSFSLFKIQIVKLKAHSHLVLYEIGYCSDI